VANLDWVWVIAPVVQRLHHFPIPVVDRHDDMECGLARGTVSDSHTPGTGAIGHSYDRIFSDLRFHLPKAT
jgi:hypothetical protein